MERQAAWTRAFQRLALPVSLIGSLSMGPPRRPLEEPEHLSHDANGHSGSLERGEESGPAPSETLVQDQADALQQAIDNTSKETLQPKHAPHPRGASWWDDICSAAHTAIRLASPGRDRMMAMKALHKAIGSAKRRWAHERLHHATEAKDIWQLASV